ncbi:MULTISPECIES: inositol monophosphatase [unclassified Ensifer]|uniref:inositol monophosphatase family protein n=1 Tax=unclassified Ensifer TaxID=2633371 RepID=UPI000813147E|nr:MULTISPECIES: inositol monophosphatase [unclassified Ensifer]OCP08430.1 inositol monophosphatase [Ensifer sp. LC11]OCP09114.1 inositol monophosphatase [Ensifer sp. LC13]OCP09897.1 inositol monophosphatase [Ensifer sp. LC14]OCP32372.1 inositol monophosphatase [Ensifer sp. LC499]
MNNANPAVGLRTSVDEDGLNRSRHLTRIAEGAARAAGAPLLAAFRSEMTVDYKRDLHDVVTIHDRNAEALIRDFIFESEPNSAMLGEEGGQVGEGEIQWYVDPIDGTANFARGLAFWCVSIAAVEQGAVVAGVVYDPVADLLFSSDIRRSYLNGKVIASKSVSEESRATLITGYPVSRDFRLDGRVVALSRFGELVETFSTVRRPGSAALSIAHVAAGFVDAAAGFGVNAWDVAAATLILKNAGGRYQPLTLGKVPADSADYLCPGYLAYGAGADYPTLNRVAQAISDGRTARTPTP